MFGVSSFDVSCGLLKLFPEKVTVGWKIFVYFGYQSVHVMLVERVYYNKWKEGLQFCSSIPLSAQEIRD